MLCLHSLNESSIYYQYEMDSLYNKVFKELFNIIKIIITKSTSELTLIRSRGTLTVL